MEVNYEIFSNNFNESKIRNSYYRFLDRLSKFNIDPLNNIYTKDNIISFNNEYICNDLLDQNNSKYFSYKS